MSARQGEGQERPEAELSSDFSGQVVRKSLNAARLHNAERAHQDRNRLFRSWQVSGYKSARKARRGAGELLHHVAVPVPSSGHSPRPEFSTTS